jgi:hypothetical protein
VTREYLDQLDDFGLAVWWMDDGSSHHIATHSFSHAEQLVICRYLLERWGVAATPVPDKKRHLEQVMVNRVAALYNIVAPHVLPSLRYKFGRCKASLPPYGALANSSTLSISE